jgi:hypothetical protein
MIEEALKRFEREACQLTDSLAPLRFENACGSVYIG